MLSISPTPIFTVLDSWWRDVWLSTSACSHDVLGMSGMTLMHGAMSRYGIDLGQLADVIVAGQPGLPLRVILKQGNLVSPGRMGLVVWTTP